MAFKTFQFSFPIAFYVRQQNSSRVRVLTEIRRARDENPTVFPLRGPIFRCPVVTIASERQSVKEIFNFRSIIARTKPTDTSIITAVGTAEHDDC